VTSLCVLCNSEHVREHNHRCLQESKLPAQLRDRAVLLSSNTEVIRSASSPRVFAQLEQGEATAIKAAWLRELTADTDGPTFARMRRELVQLNELYATALHQAAALAEARRQGLLDDVIMQPLQQIAGSSLETTMIAVDAINGMEPVALCIQPSVAEQQPSR
jgi:hypothetical protein